MPKFIQYKDELINLDLVVKISKNQNRGLITIIFNTTNDMISLEFENEEIRDKTFDDICYSIALN